VTIFGVPDATPEIGAAVTSAAAVAEDALAVTMTVATPTDALDAAAGAAEDELAAAEEDEPSVIAIADDEAAAELEAGAAELALEAAALEDTAADVDAAAELAGADAAAALFIATSTPDMAAVSVLIAQRCNVRRTVVVVLAEVRRGPEELHDAVARVLALAADVRGRREVELKVGLWWGRRM
jgi:hypothetical protein